MKQSKDKDYDNHSIFKTLSDFKEFYKALAYSVMTWIQQGIQLKNIVNYETSVYSALNGTLDSMQLVLSAGRINDAFALARKYDDGIMTDLYSVIYIQLHKDDNEIVEKINNWVYNNSKFPLSSEMLKYILQYENTSDLQTIISTDDYNISRKYCNNHVHYNSLHCMMLNDIDLYLDDRMASLDQLENCIISFFAFHFGYMFSINPQYMMASDLTDYLDFGQTPPPGSEKWVAPFIQDIFSKYIKVKYPKLAEYMLRNSPMELKWFSFKSIADILNDSNEE